MLEINAVGKIDDQYGCKENHRTHMEVMIFELYEHSLLVYGYRSVVKQPLGRNFR